MMLSRGARLCEQIIRTARVRRGGARECGRPYLARRLGCSARQVSRYVAELREAGRLEVTPPRRQRTANGWRTLGVNTYRLPRPGHPAPHVLDTHNRRSRRGDTPVTPPPRGGRMRGRSGPASHDPAELTNPAEAIAAMLARLTPPGGGGHAQG